MNHHSNFAKKFAAEHTGTLMKKFPIALFVVTCIGAFCASVVRHHESGGTCGLTPWYLSESGRTGFNDVAFQGGQTRTNNRNPTDAPSAASRNYNDEVIDDDPKVNDAAKMRALEAFLMQSILSVIICSAALFVILANRFAPTDRHWAYATVGTLLGFWMRSVG